MTSPLSRDWPRHLTPPRPRVRPVQPPWVWLCAITLAAALAVIGGSAFGAAHHAAATMTEPD